MKKSKLKKKLVFKKSSTNSDSKEDLNPTRPNLKRYHEFIDSFREKNSIQQVVGCIRTWYEKVFDKFPPLDDHPLELIKTKIQYELLKRDHDEVKAPLSPKVLQNYEASRDFNIEGFTNGIKEIIKISIDHEGGEVQMGKVTKVAKSQKKKEVKAKAQKARASAETVTQTYERLFKENANKKFKDNRLAELVCKAHPNKKTYTEADIRSVRSMYNNGKLSTQNTAPKTKSVSYGSAKGKAKASPAPKVKAKAKKVAVKKVVKKKLVLKKKK